MQLAMPSFRCYLVYAVCLLGCLEIPVTMAQAKPAVKAHHDRPRAGRASAPAALAPPAEAKPLQLVQLAGGKVQGVGGRYALIVGVNGYARTGLGDLKYSENDAKAVYDVLTHYGGFPEQNVRLLLGDKATGGEILLYLDKLSDPATFPGADTFVLYYSGHGGVLDSRSASANAQGQKDNFLIPSDGTNIAALAQRQNIALDDVQRLLDRSVFKRKVVLLDACRNVLQVDARGGSMAALDFSRYSFAEGLKIMTGTKYGELSWEDDSLGHGVFTYYILQGLLGAGSDEQGVVTLAGLESYVARGLGEYGRGHPGRTQTPQVYGEGLSMIPLTVAPDAGAAQALLTPAPLSWVLKVLGLDGAQDAEAVQLAEQTLDARGWIKPRDGLPDALWLAAERKLADLQLTHPSPLEAYLSAGVQLRLGEHAADSASRYRGALDQVQRALQQRPAWIQARALNAGLLLRTGQSAAAINAFNDLLQLDAASIEAHNGLAEAYLAQQDYAAAERETRAVLALDPVNSAALSFAKLVDLATHPTGLAAKIGLDGWQDKEVLALAEALLTPDLDTIEEYETQSPQWVANESVLRAKLAAQRSPLTLSLLTLLDRNLSTKNGDSRASEGLALSAELLGVAPGSAFAHYARAEALSTAGEQVEAVHEYQAALALQPALGVGHIGLAAAFAAQNRDQEAVAECRLAIQLLPGCHSAHAKLGWVLQYHLHLPAEAEAEYQIALRLSSRCDVTYSNIGNLYVDTRNYNDAISMFRTALRLNPRNKWAHNGLGVCYSWTNRFTEAAAEYNAALNIDPDFGDAQTNLRKLNQ